MTRTQACIRVLQCMGLALLTVAGSAQAHKLRQAGTAVTVADSTLTVTPPHDWNRLDVNIGKNTESWTADGQQLNDITFFAGITDGRPLVRERSKKREPLPKFTGSTLLVEVPELLENTYRTYKQSGSFKMMSIAPEPFLGHDGVAFAYEFVDEDNLTRQGEARATIVAGKLYMMTFEAPRLSYFSKGIGDFRALAQSARLP